MLDSGLPLLYIVVRFFFAAQVDSLGNWAMYGLEIALVLTMMALRWRRLRDDWHLPRALLKFVPVFFAAGALAAWGAFQLGFQIPIQALDSVDMLLLLGIAPLLEELLFRFFLLLPFQGSVRARWGLPFTALVFSYAHAHALWYVPPEWRNFVVYQTCYTLVLGAGCGFAVLRLRSWPGAYLFHFAFNFGFWLVLLAS